MPPAQIAPIRRSDTATVSQLRSTITITSLSDILTELLHNAIDADAEQVDCWINLETWGLRVSDDGRGIRKQDMKLLGERYSTSKRIEEGSEAQTYGSRGEALASIAALSLLEVTSKHDSEPRGSTKIIKGGETLACGPSKRYVRETAGTVVTIKDAFYNVPVRRIDTARGDPFLSAATAALNISAPRSTLFACKKALELVAGVNPRVGFTLTLEEESAADGREIKRMMTVVKEESLIKRFGTLHGSSLIDKAQKVHVSCRGMRIDGFFSLSPAYTKAHQLIYLNKFHLDRCDLHTLISGRFAKSNLGKTEDSTERIKTTRSPKLGASKPIYLLDIQLAAENVDAALEPRKRDVVTRDYCAMSQFVAAVVDEVLVKAGLLASVAPAKCISDLVGALPASISPQTPRMSLERQFGCQPSPSPKIGAPLRSRAKRKTQFVSDSSRHEMPIDTATSTGRPQWLSELLASKTHKPYQPLTTANPVNLDMGDTAGNNRRTHNELPFSSDRISVSKEDLRYARVIAQVDCKFICCSIPSRTRAQAAHALVLIDQHAADERIRVHRYLEDICNSFGTTGLPQHDLSKNPKKLIMPAHRVQWLVNCQIARHALRQWGFSIGLPSIDFINPADEFCQITLLGVPLIVYERLSAYDGKESQKIIDSYVEYLMDNGVTGLAALLRAFEGDDEIAVEKTVIMRWCPKRLLDLINSKACRGAIMFNDPLTIDQCCILIRRLSHTDFPFICAHGRPSIAPLAECIPGTAKGLDARLAIDWKNAHF